jgi:hypothetical protein
VAQLELYAVVGDEDGRWWVIDGDVCVNDVPYHSREAAIEHRDRLNAELIAALAGKGL